jgi:hypothetical protein
MVICDELGMNPESVKKDQQAVQKKFKCESL